MEADCAAPVASSAYQVFGICLRSEIELSSNQLALSPAQIALSLSDNADVNAAPNHSLLIRQRPVPVPQPSKVQQVAACCWVSEQQVWLDIPHLGRLFISPAEIAVDAGQAADQNLLQVYLQGYALGIHAMLQGKLVLHATTLCRGDKAIVLCGSSGSGKSTLAAALLSSGFRLVSDEITIIDENGLVQPGFDDIKVWQDAAEVLALPADQLQPIRQQIQKFLYRPVTRHAQPVRPAAVYILANDNRKTAELTELKGFAKFEPLRGQYYRTFLTGPLQLDASYLQLSGRHLGALPLVRVTRGSARLTADRLTQLATAITDDATQRGI